MSNEKERAPLNPVDLSFNPFSFPRGDIKIYRKAAGPQGDQQNPTEEQAANPTGGTSGGQGSAGEQPASLSNEEFAAAFSNALQNGDFQRLEELARMSEEAELERQTVGDVEEVAENELNQFVEAIGEKLKDPSGVYDYRLTIFDTESGGKVRWITSCTRNVGEVLN